MFVSLTNPGRSHSSRLQPAPCNDFVGSNTPLLNMEPYSPKLSPFPSFDQLTSFLGNGVKGQSPAVRIPPKTAVHVRTSSLFMFILYILDFALTSVLHYSKDGMFSCRLLRLEQTVRDVSTILSLLTSCLICRFLSSDQSMGGFLTCIPLCGSVPSCPGRFFDFSGATTRWRAYHRIVNNE